MAQSVSSAFRPALLLDHTVAVTAQVVDPTDGILATLQPIGGTVTIDIDRSIRREASDIELVDPDGTLTPNDIRDILSPLSGNEIKLQRGIEYASGTTELVTLGKFQFSNVTVANDGDGVRLTVGGLQDRGARIARARYVTPAYVTVATALETVVSGLIQRGWADCPGLAGLPTTGITIRSRGWGSEGDSDPWNDAVDLCDTHGYRLYFGPNGYVQMEEIQSIGELTPVATYDSTTTMITSISRTWDSEGTYNGVIATGEGSGLLIPYRSVAWDDDPTSATYYLGDFGQRPRFYSSPNLYSKADATRAATLQLRKTLGVTELLSWEQIPDPSIDVGDAITVVNSGVAVDNTYRVDRIEIPLGATGPMSVTARARRVSGT